MRAFKFLGSTFSKRVGLSTLASGAASVLDFLSFLLVARILNAEELGIFLVSLMIGAGLVRIGTLNLANVALRAATRAIEQGNARDLKFILDFGAACDGGLLVLALIAGAISAHFLVSGENLILFAMVVMTVLINPVKPQLLSTAVPRAFGHHVALYLLVLLGATLKTALLYAAWSLEAGYSGVLFSFFVWQIVPAAGGLLLTVRESGRRGALSQGRSSFKAFKESHPEFIPLMRSGGLTGLPQLAFDFATPIVGFIGSIGTAGLFGLAVKISQAVRIYAEPLTYTLYAKQCRAVEHGQLRSLARQTTLWAAGLAGITALVSLTFKIGDVTFIGLAFGTDYIAAIPAVQWCLIAAIPTTAAMPLQFGLFALGRANRVLQAEAMGALTFLVLLMAMAGRAETAAVALAASRLVASMASWAFFRHYTSFARQAPGTRRADGPANTARKGGQEL
ncbi:lipopolysaccharide biosynthesis protein [Roseibium sp. M-1]